MESTAGAHVLIVVFSGLFGLMIGSFLNVVIYRLPRGMSVAHPPSHCPNCGTQLRSIDNIPLLSWAFLRGKCRSCGISISPRYPLVELTTCLVFIAFAAGLGSADPLVGFLVVAASTIAAAGIDHDGLDIPWSVVIASLLGVAVTAVVAAFTSEPGRLGWGALGAALSIVAFCATEKTTRPVLASGWSRRAVLGGCLGWCAGWLWAPGGVILAAWVVVVLVTSRRPTRSIGILLPVALGAFAVIIAGAALNT